VDYLVPTLAVLILALVVVLVGLGAYFVVGVPGDTRSGR
jgi:hypothetical protein